MKGTKVYIVEDMAVSRMALEDLLLDNGFEVCGSAASAEKALRQILEQPVDLVLVDIHLAGTKNGVWLVHELRKCIEIPIIFLTAYGDTKTVEDVIDTKPNGYLMKPYNEPTLLTTIAIALENFHKEQASKNKNKQIVQDKILFIKDSYAKVRLVASEIQYIKSDGNYIEIYLSQKSHLVREKLQNFLKKLPQDQFIRVHQRFAVNKNAIDIIGKEYLHIQGADIPISKTYKKEMSKHLNIN